MSVRSQVFNQRNRDGYKKARCSIADKKSRGSRLGKKDIGKM
jgi:hypothetical protein